MIHAELDRQKSLLIVAPEGPLTADDFRNVAKLVDPYIADKALLRGLLVRAPSFPGWDIFGALMNGAALYPYDVNREGLSNLAGWMAEQKITIYHSTPTLYRHLLATLDPLAAMAGTDAAALDALDALLTDVRAGSDAVAELLDGLRPAGAEAVLAGEPQIEQHQVVGSLRQRLARGFGAGRDIDRVTGFAKPALQIGGKLRFILDQQQTSTSHRRDSVLSTGSHRSR